MNETNEPAMWEEPLEAPDLMRPYAEVSLSIGGPVALVVGPLDNHPVAKTLPRSYFSVSESEQRPYNLPWKSEAMDQLPPISFPYWAWSGKIVWR